MAEVFEIFQFLVALIAPVAIPLALWNWRKSAVVVWLTAYLGIYFLLSINGKWVPYIGGASDGSMEWYAWRTDNRTPSNGGRIKSGPSPLGFFYLPLLGLDQKFWHQTIEGDDPRAQEIWREE